MTTESRGRLAAIAPYLGAGLLALVLVLPGFVYPYLFDDYDYLVRGMRFTPASLLPAPGDVFWRPFSREIYFAVLQALSPAGPLLGHALNALALVAASLLMVDVGTRFLGRREGALAGLAFAGLGQAPILVAWVSGAQDAFAIAFTLGALSLESRRRHWGALALAAIALLSKETAAAALPSLALAHWIVRGGEKGARSGAFDYAILGVLWAALHPGFHALASRGLAAGATGYVGLGAGDAGTSLLRYTTLLVNLPSPGLGVNWPAGLTFVAAIGAAVALVVARFIPAAVAEPASATVPSFSPRRAFAVAALLLLLLPLLASAFLVRNWSPYYIAFPGLGAAFLLAMGASRLPNRALLLVVPLYVVAGIYVRGLVVAPGMTNERSLAPAASALLRLQGQLHALAPAMPRGSQVLIANDVLGVASVQAHLYRLPTLAQWYRDPSLRVARPESREPDYPAEFLFWIDRETNLFQVDLAALQPRSTGETASPAGYAATMRAWTRGLAESGEVDRAVSVLLTMPERTESGRWIDRRLAASYLAAHGRADEAVALLRGAPPLDPRVAAGMVTEFLWQPTRVERYDAATLWAFGLDERNPESWRAVMRNFAETGNRAAVRFATRLLGLRPGDRDAERVLKVFAASDAKRAGPNSR